MSTTAAAAAEQHQQLDGTWNRRASSLCRRSSMCRRLLASSSTSPCLEAAACISCPHRQPVSGCWKGLDYGSMAAGY